MRKILDIATSTFRESIRSKILYSILVFVVLLLGMSAFFGSVTIGSQLQVISNFGLFSVSLFSVLYAAISGAALLHKELSRKTVYNILARAVTRSEFLVGKYLGMLYTVTAMVAIMGAGLFAFTAVLEGSPSWSLLTACFHIWLELIIICAAAIFFSSIVVTPLLSGMFTFGFFLAGRSAEYLLYFIKQDLVSGWQAWLLQGLYVLLPHFDRINISDLSVYGILPAPAQTLAALVYAAGYAAVLLILADIIFRRREFN